MDAAELLDSPDDGLLDGLGDATGASEDAGDELVTGDDELDTCTLDGARLDSSDGEGLAKMLDRLDEDRMLDGEDDGAPGEATTELDGARDELGELDEDRTLDEETAGAPGEAAMDEEGLEDGAEGLDDRLDEGDGLGAGLVTAADDLGELAEGDKLDNAIEDDRAEEPLVGDWGAVGKNHAVLLSQRQRSGLPCLCSRYRAMISAADLA